MAIFVLDCESVKAAITSFDNVCSSLSQVQDSVLGYDTSCADNFDFNGAKNAIAANINACSIKVKNTIDLINSVINEHTNLQNSIKFEYEGQIKKSSGNNNLQTNSVKTKSNSFSIGTTNGNSLISNNVASSVVVGTMASSSNQGVEEIKSEVGQDVKKKDDFNNSTESNSKRRKLSKKIRKRIFSNGKFKYSSKGYGMLSNRYVISCDSSFGNVGDGLTLKCVDGTEIKCVIGSISNSDNVNFYVNELWNEGNNILTENIDKVKNTGLIEDLKNIDTEII